MDIAVGLVEAYLRVNGYFTVTEYPVIEAVHYGGYRALTDLDILAFRFPGAGRIVAGDKSSHDMEPAILPPDPKLGISTGEHADMIIGEVKEGRAELNRAISDPVVLRAVLTRFGCCHAQHIPDLVSDLLRKGSGFTSAGHRVRLVAFGSIPDHSGKPRHTVISLGHVVNFLSDYIHQYFGVLHNADFKDPAFGFLLMLEKIRHGTQHTAEADEGGHLDSGTNKL